MNGSVPASPAVPVRAAGRVVRKVGLAVVLFVAAAACAPATVDLEAIRAADRAYAEAWLANDPERVMAALTENPVLIPSGLPVVRGNAAIRAFWWPSGSPATTVREFRLTQQEAGGDGKLGFVRGSFTLEFVYDGEAYSSGGEYLTLLERSARGEWRISHRMWSDHPPPTD